MGDPRRGLDPLTPPPLTGIQWGPLQTESPFCPQMKFPLVCSQQQLRALLVPELICFVHLIQPQAVVEVVAAAAAAAAAEASAAAVVVALAVVVVVFVAAAAAAVVAVDDDGGRGP